MAVQGVTARARGAPDRETRRPKPPERAEPAGIDLSPASAYEAVTRQMVDGLREELREIRSRINGLIFMVAGAAIVDLIFRLTDGVR